VLQGGTHWLHVPQHKKQQEETAGQTNHTIEILHSHHNTLSDVYRLQSTNQIVGHMITEQIAVDTAADAVNHTVADEAGNGETHEEMLKRHQFFEIDGQRTEEYNLKDATFYGTLTCS